jgi:hypothetical protein
MTPSFLIIVPTYAGRTALLERAVRSVEPQLGLDDQILIITDGRVDVPLFGPQTRYLSGPETHDHAATQRNLALQMTWSQTHALFLDDDDQFLPDVLPQLRGFVALHPDRFILGRFIFKTGLLLWDTPTVTVGHIGTPSIVLPLEDRRFGVWTNSPTGDFDFIHSTIVARGDQPQWLNLVLQDMRP